MTFATRADAYVARIESVLDHHLPPAEVAPRRLHEAMRYGARTLFKNPGLTLIAVVTLTLGIATNTAQAQESLAGSMRATWAATNSPLIALCWLHWALSGICGW